MATRLFSRAAEGVTLTVSPAPNLYRRLFSSTFSQGASGNSVVLTAGSSAFHYVLSTQAQALPAATGTFLGSWRVFVQFQSVTPTNVYTKFRVHRGTISGTVVTIVATSEWSGERLTNLTTQRWELNLDQVDLGTWASTDRVIIETNYRNAGASSITIQPTSGAGYANAIDSPFTTSAAFGYTNNLPVGQRVYNYSRGGINSTSRYLVQQQYISSSTGTATGTKGGQDFSGSVTGVSTSSGTIAAGLQGYEGSSTGSSTSSGTVNGSPGPVPDTGGAVPQWWYTEQERQPQPEPLQVLALTGAIQAKALYATGRVRGRVGYIGSAIGTNRVESFITAARVGYSGSVPLSTLGVRGRVLRGRSFTTDEMLILMGEL